jgi:hypothetical protein
LQLSETASGKKRKRLIRTGRSFVSVIVKRIHKPTGVPKMVALATCPKCQGAKKINAFRHIEAGVCFMCKGHGTIVSRGEWTPPTTEQKEKSARETAEKRAWLLAATTQQLESLTWKQIHSARGFVVACIVNGDHEMKRVEAAVNAAFNRALEEKSQNV